MEVFDGRNKNIRVTVFGLSFFWFVFGIVCMVFGGGQHGIVGKTEETFHLHHIQVSTCAMLLIPIGSLIIFMSFMGCGAAIKGSRRMTFSYLTVLLILALIKIIIACVLFSRYTENYIEKTVEDDLRSVLNETELVEVTDRHKTDTLFGNVSVIASHVHKIHEENGCCGVRGPHFYDKEKVPYSCCNDTELHKFNYCMEPYENGCIDQVLSVITEAKASIGNFLIGISIIEIIVCCIEFSISKDIKDI